MVLAVAGIVLLLLVAGPAVRHHADARVLARAVAQDANDPDNGPVTVLDVRLLDVRSGATGATGTTQRVVAGPEAAADPSLAPGRVVTVTTGGLGRTTLGADDLLRPWVFGVLLLALAAGRTLHDRRRPGVLYRYR